MKNTIQPTTPKIGNVHVQLIREGNFIRHKWVNTLYLIPLYQYQISHETLHRKRETKFDTLSNRRKINNLLLKL